MQYEIYLKKALKYIVYILIWFCFLYLGRFYFFYNVYVEPSYLYYIESSKDFEELKNYIDEKD